MLLFVDFDGVLHPDAVYLRCGRAELRAEGQLFMWAHYLQAVVEEADVQIVLSTSWARHLGYQRARKALPEPVSRLVVGATWHSAMKKGGALTTVPFGIRKHGMSRFNPILSGCGHRSNGWQSMTMTWGGLRRNEAT